MFNKTHQEGGVLAAGVPDEDGGDGRLGFGVFLDGRDVFCNQRGVFRDQCDVFRDGGCGSGVFGWWCCAGCGLRGHSAPGSCRCSAAPGDLEPPAEPRPPNTEQKMNKRDEKRLTEQKPSLTYLT